MSLWEMLWFRKKSELTVTAPTPGLPLFRDGALTPDSHPFFPLGKREKQAQSLRMAGMGTAREKAPPPTHTVIKKGIFPWLTEKGGKKIFLVKFQMAGSWLERD